MSLNGGNEENRGNSPFWRSSGSSKDKQPAPSGSAQPNSSSASGGGWGGQSSSKPRASGGSGWGRPPGSFDHPAAVCGGWGRPNFAVVLIAALLLLPGVTQVIADEFTQDYIQKNQIVTPHTQDDIDRAIEAFNRQQAPQPAPQPVHRLSERDRLIRFLIENGIEALPLHLQEQLQTFRMISNCLFFVQDLDDQKLKDLQRSLCNHDRGVLLGVIAISRDKTGGLKLSLFKQSLRYDCTYINRDVNGITIVCVTCTGTRKKLKAVGDGFKVEKGQEYGTNHVYGNQMTPYVNVNALVPHSSTKPVVFVPMSDDCFAVKSSEQNPEFEDFCIKVMKSQGCVVVPPFSALTATKIHASTAEVASEAPVESLTISCHHGNRVKNFDGKYQSCQDCLRHPGKGTILDGWGDVVGYKAP